MCMEQPQKSLTSVTLERRNWNAITGILESDCRRKGKDWIVWGNQVKDKIQSSIGKPVAPDDLCCVSLPDETWNAIINSLKSNCPSKGKDWELWGNNIVKRIRDSIGGVKNQISQDNNVAAENNQSNSNTASQNSQPIMVEVSPEAIRCYEKAMNLWGETAIGELDVDKKKDITAFLALAVKKAGVPYPLAESKLSLFLYMLGEVKDAVNHANKALEYDPNSFTGQLVRVFNALDSIRVKKLGAGDFLSGGGGSIEGAVVASVFKGFFSIIGATAAATTQTSGKKEIIRLVEIYRRVCPRTTDVDEFFHMSQLLINLGDFIKDIPFAGGRPNLFAEVVNAPISQLEISGRETDIDDILLRAEGKSELFKP